MSKAIISLLLLLTTLPASVTMAASADKTIREKHVRTAVNKGNKAYRDSNFVEAEKYYLEALKEDSLSAIADFNLALTRIHIGKDSDMKEDDPKHPTNLAKSALMALGADQSADKAIRTKSYYNLGNLAFNAKDYTGAIAMYKDALRIDPADNKARQNLRIAQIMQQQNPGGGGGQDQNQDKQDQDQQDKQDQQQQQQDQQQKDQQQKDQQQNKDQQQQQQDQQKDQNQQQNRPQGGQPQAKPDGISKENAQRILQAIEKKDNEVRRDVEEREKVRMHSRQPDKPW